MNFNKLGNIEGQDDFYINSKRKFNALGEFKENTINIVFQFAYDMSFGGKGKHRKERSGGDEKRKNGQIFADAFQGKLAECAVWNIFNENLQIKLPIPDMETWGKGKWDRFDFEYKDKKISVKSTKSIGNLLLLETKDWNINGEYIPNINICEAKYDFHILIRINPSCNDILTSVNLLNCDQINQELFNQLYEKIISNKWSYDFAGYITNDNLIHTIKNNFVIPKGAFLNGSMKMDAENYYVQAGDMRELKDLKELL